MQYPLTDKAARRFVHTLYESLAARSTIEEAVQAARSELFNHFEGDRLFGAPALYMQSIDSQLLPTRTGTPAGADAGPGSVSAAETPTRTTAEYLSQALRGINASFALLSEVEQLVRRENWPAALPDVHPRLARKVRDYAYRPELAAIFRALVAVVEADMGEPRG
jgi:hypothetical protein